MRTHLTPFVSGETTAAKAVLASADSDLVSLAVQGMRPRRPGTPRWDVMNDALPRGEEAWMNAKSEFEEALREKDAALCRAMIQAEARKEVIDAVEKALSSCHGMMRFRTSHWIFWSREEPFRISRDRDGDLKIRFGDDSIRVTSYDGWFRVTSGEYGYHVDERVHMMSAGAAAAAMELTRHVVRILARTAIPTRGRTP